MLHLISTVVLALIALGLWFRRRQPRWHVPLMATAFTCDLLLVLYIEATRHAVETVAGTATSFIWFHATVSTLVLAGYVLQLGLGRRLLAGRAASRRLHATVGVTFVALRSLNYVTSFWM